jgi:hypothetical protein
MGLDQYLYAEKYYSTYTNNKDNSETLNKLIEVADAVDFADADMPTAIIRVKVAQWRKANQIHKWFVDICQNGEDDCRDSYVDLERLYTLKELCELVLAEPTQAMELLPVFEGFFFGGNEYDEWYFEQLKDVISVIDKIGKMGDEWSFVYSSSW